MPNIYKKVPRSRKAATATKAVPGLPQAQIGLIGLATMGANLAHNIANKKFTVAVFNRTTEKTRNFIEEFGNHRPTAGQYLIGTYTLKQFTQSLKRPRKIILLVKAGEAVDDMIAKLIPHLNKRDIILDMGNSHYLDTERRYRELKKKGLNFIGCGISGGEKGALLGPSIMPGGDKSAYHSVEKILESIAAKSQSKKTAGSSSKCVTYIGPGSSGHFVKMVHNGIEYAIMQLIAETYDFLKTIGKFSNKQLGKIFAGWNKSKNLKSFLIKITAEILSKKESTKYILDFISDHAEQKGTGKWTIASAMELGISIPTITAAVTARILSGDKELRARRKNLPLKLNKTGHLPKKSELIKLAAPALELSTIISYSQGFELLKKASEENNWNLNLSEIARIWTNGCIIRSNLLLYFQGAYSDNQSAVKIAKRKILKNFSSPKQKSWRKFISLATNYAIPIPALSSALAYYDSICKKSLPQNLIQAQRDYFGAHGYERIDKKGWFHTEW